MLISDWSSDVCSADLGMQKAKRGRILLAGVPLAALTPSARARRMAYLAQAGEVHWPMTTARVVALGRLPPLGPWQRPRPADFAAIAAAMAECEVAALADRPLGRLSGGPRARVTLPRPLAPGPRLPPPAHPASLTAPHPP